MKHFSSPLVKPNIYIYKVVILNCFSILSAFWCTELTKLTFFESAQLHSAFPAAALSITEVFNSGGPSSSFQTTGFPLARLRSPQRESSPSKQVLW